MGKKTGFTLIELMIVIAVIVILAVIALPGLLRARLQTNEAAAVANLRTVCGASLTYNAARGHFGDFTALTTGPPQFLNGTWHDGVEKMGYRFRMPPISDHSFICYADPVTPGTTGTRWFRVDTSGWVRYNMSGPPSDTDPVVGD